MVVQKNVTIREDQEKWVEENYINLSRFLQAKLDEEIAKRKGERKGKGGEDGD